MSDSPPLPPGWRLRSEELAPDPAAPPVPQGWTLRPQPVTPTPEAPMSWGDWGRAAMTTGVRSVGDLVGGLTDPLEPVRNFIFPELGRLERAEQKTASVPSPGEVAYRTGTDIFKAYGVPEFEPTTGLGRVGMAVTRGAVGGAILGGIPALVRGAAAAVPTIASSLLGGTSGGTGQLAYEYTKPPEISPEQEQALTPEQRTSRQSQQDWAERYATLGSLVPGGAIAAAGRRAAPRMTPDMNAAGVNPTIGQALGGWANRIEQGIGSIPYFGDFMKTGRAGAVEEMNTGAINTKILAPIGKKLDPETPSGRPAIAAAQDKVGEHYNAIEPHLSVTPDRQFGTALTDINRKKSMLSDDFKNQFDQTFNTEVRDRFGGGTTLTGKAFRDAESTLGQIATNYRSSSIARERDYGNLILDLQTELRNLQKRRNPDYAADLANIHTAYSALTRIEKAATKPNAGIGGALEYGNYTPGALQAATREMDPTLRHRSFARGDAILQEYAENARKLLGDTVPDSGTPFRSLIPLAGGAGAAGLLSLPLMLGAAGTGAGLGALYSPQGRAAAAYLLRRPGQMLPRGLLAAPEQEEFR